MKEILLGVILRQLTMTPSFLQLEERDKVKDSC